jgi:hypothetical protein
MVQELVRIDQRIRRMRPLKIEKLTGKIQALGFFVSRSQSLTKSSRFDP